jgi:hypothetical protein
MDLLKLDIFSRPHLAKLQSRKNEIEKQEGISNLYLSPQTGGIFKKKRLCRRLHFSGYEFCSFFAENSFGVKGARKRETMRASLRMKFKLLQPGWTEKYALAFLRR